MTTQYPWFRLWPADFMADTIHWPTEAVGCYFRLLCIQWLTGSVPQSAEDRERAAPGCGAHWAQYLEPKFRVIGNRLLNYRMEEERGACAYRASVSSRAGKTSAEKRKGRSTDVERALNGRSTSQSQSQSQIDPDTAHAARASAPTRLRRSEPDAIRWEPESGWSGITDADRKAWAVAYPACDLTRQLAAMDQWLRANPAKARRSAWRRFVTSWLSRSQDRGGDTPSAPRNGTLNHADPVARRAAQREREFPEPTPIIVPRINP